MILRATNESSFNTQNLKKLKLSHFDLSRSLQFAPTARMATPAPTQSRDCFYATNPACLSINQLSTSAPISFKHLVQQIKEGGDEKTANNTMPSDLRRGDESVLYTCLEIVPRKEGYEDTTGRPCCF